MNILEHGYLYNRQAVPTELSCQPMKLHLKVIITKQANLSGKIINSKSIWRNSSNSFFFHPERTVSVLEPNVLE